MPNKVLMVHGLIVITHHCHMVWGWWVYTKEPFFHSKKKKKKGGNSDALWICMIALIIYLQ